MLISPADLRSWRESSLPSEGFFLPSRSLADLRGFAQAVIATAHGAAGIETSNSGFVLTSDSNHVTLLTSGTTGQPKTIRKSISFTSYTSRRASPGTWFVPYAPSRWASITTILHAWSSLAGISFPARSSLDCHVEAIREDVPDFLVCSPTYLRLLNAKYPSELRAAGFKLVSLGGEPAKQRDLTLVREELGAEAVHTYATSEDGDILRVRDGIAGLPIEAVESNPRLRIANDGEMIVDGRQTGDLWDVIDSRFVFRGRKGRSILVAGALVEMEEIESESLRCEGVEFARVTAQPSGLVGNVVSLEYAGSATPSAVRLFLARRLAKTSLPRLITQVSQELFENSWKNGRAE